MQSLACPVIALIGVTGGVLEPELPLALPGL